MILTITLQELQDILKAKTGKDVLFRTVNDNSLHLNIAAVGKTVIDANLSNHYSGKLKDNINIDKKAVSRKISYPTATTNIVK